MITHIEHIGIAVKDLNQAIKFYEDFLGTKCYAVEEVADQKVKTAFFKVGETKIELLEGTSSESPIVKFIEKRGEGIHHIAYAVDDIESKLNELKGKNIQLIDTEPRLGAEGLQIAFIHPKAMNGVLTEICSHKK
jgi:methylmalonyl-CoA/ethylmalonyl-CoA epimerase